MKKMEIKRILSFILALLFLLPASVSCNDRTSGDVPLSDESSSAAVTTAEPEPDTFNFVKDGVPVFRIIRPDVASDAALTAMRTVRDGLADIFGTKFNVDTDWFQGYVKGSVVENDEFEILIGKTHRKETLEASEQVAKNQYLVKVIGHKIVIAADRDGILIDAAEDFINAVKNSPARNLLSRSYTASGEKKIIVSAEADPYLNGLRLQSEETKVLADGITMYTRHYADKSGLPVVAYSVEMLPGKGYVYTGTPEDGTVLMNKRGSVYSQMKAAADKGLNVVCGVNGDFFDIGKTYVPSGLCIKEGQLLSSKLGEPFFAFLKDGTPIIVGPGLFPKYQSQIRTAVAGSCIILREGKPADLQLTLDFGKTRHPRTAVGCKADGTVVLTVVDGRQAKISNGAALVDLAQIMLESDCVSALNLDGGGSSTFVTMSDYGKKWKLENSPSDGSMRYVSDCLFIIAK